MVRGHAGSEKLNNQSCQHHRRRAFTLVELLVVIAIIGVLVALLLPAVNSARASARRTQCLTKLRQISLAVLNYDSQFQVFPPAVTNDEQAKYSMFAYILPFLEETTVFNQIEFNQDWDATSQTEDFFNGVNLSAALVCPSAPMTRDRYRQNSVTETIDANESTVVDYVPIHSINLDSTAGTGTFNGIEVSRLRTLVADQVINDSPSGPRGRWSGDNTKWWGILREQDSLTDARIKTAHIRDGLSNTILLTETAGRPQGYVGSYKTTQQITSHKWFFGNLSISVNAHCSGAIVNCTNTSEVYSFHKGVAAMSHADGSVHFRNEGIDPELFISLYTMAGRDSIDESGL